MAAKDKGLHVKCSEGEREQWKDAAKAAGMTTSDWVRKALMLRMAETL